MKLLGGAHLPPPRERWSRAWERSQAKSRLYFNALFDIVKSMLRAGLCR
jgi:hypothetical protein